MRTAVAIFVVSGAILLGAQASPTAPNQIPGTPLPGAARTPPPAGRGAPAQVAATAVIRGRIVAADTGTPLRRAQVRLTGPGLAPPNYPYVSSDEQGRYEFRSVTAGRYTVTVTKPGYLTMSYAQRRSFDEGRTVDVRDGETVERIDFSLPKGSVVAVTVTDDVGDPITGVRVQAERFAYFAQFGRRMPVAVAFGETNDRGEARITALPPGDYFISANAGFGRTNPALAASDSGRRYAEPTYYPGTTRANEAQPVSVAVGQEAVASFSLVPVRTVRLTGAIRTSDGIVPSGINLNVQQQFASSFSMNSIAVQPDGTFEIPTMMPGDYVLTVRPPTAIGLPAPPNASGGAVASGEYARAQLTVGSEDITGFVVTTTRATPVRGHLVFAEPMAPRVFALPLTVVGALSAGRATLNDDLTFEIDAVAGPGTLRPPTQNASAGMFLKSVTLAGKDVTDIPTDFSRAREYADLEVVMTSKRTEVTGSVTNSRNAPVTDYAVVVFPEERARWSDNTRLIAVGRADQEGRFRVVGLPPGRYVAAAVDGLSSGEERDPDLLSRLLADAQRITLAEGESRTLSLRLD